MSRTARIDQWIKSHPPCPKAYEDVFAHKRTEKRQHPAATADINKRRKQSIDSQEAKLQEISGNCMAPSRGIPRRSPRKEIEQGMQDQSAEIGAPKTPGHPRHGVTKEDMSLDTEQTPRGPPSLSSIPDLPPRHFDGSEESFDLSSRSPTASQASRRNLSPRKALGNLRLANIQVESSSFRSQKYTPSEDAMVLKSRLTKIENKRGVLPASMRHKAKAYLEDDDDWFFDQTSPLADDSSGYSLEEDACWTRALEISDAAIECQERKYNESAWNSEVHSTLLRLALRYQWRGKGIWYRDVTSSRVIDKSLLSSVPNYRPATKMVDYTFCIEYPPHSKLDLGIIDAMNVRDLSSINHADSEEVRFHPIAVYIETKRAHIDEEQAELQLITWVVAHYTKLKRMTKIGTQMPILPLITALGHDWKFLIAEMVSSDRIVIFKEVRIGETDTVIGVYHVMAALRILAQWMHEEYLPWFTRYVLGDFVMA